MTLSTIYKPIQEDLAKVDERLKSISQATFPSMSELLAYSLQRGGKGIRPALTFLAGKFHNYDIAYLLPMATAIELMHTATLVHDDAIDKSLIRRGRPTINKKWSEEKAILLGDYLFAKAGELTATTGNLKVIRLFARTIQIISSGELNQSFSAFNIEQTREQYLERIAKKTASLFILAMESGAILSQAPENLVKLLKVYGYNLGIAFQIIDDLLDFIGTKEEMGKPVGSDLAQGTLTLPAMLLLERYPEENPVKRLFQGENNQENIELVLGIVRNSSIVQECYNLASDYGVKANHNLMLLPDNSSRQSLQELVNYVIDRKR
ncbi:polyprenyl synthetase family protein [Chloroflexota bacterium]